MSKIYHTFIDNAGFLDIVMLMYNLLEYSDNNSMKLGSLWKYYGVEVNDTVNENSDDGNYVPSKYLPSINCKIELANAPATTTSATFQMNNSKTLCPC